MVESANLNALRAPPEWHIQRRYLTVLFFLFFYTLQPLPLPAQKLSNALYTPTVVSVFSTLNNPAEMDNHGPKITTVLNLALLNYLFQDSLEKDNNSNLFPESSGYESLGYESLTSYKRAIQQTFREAFQKTEPLSRENNNGVKNARAETKIRYNNFLSASKKEKISENPYEENSEDFYEESRYLAWNAKKFQDCQEQAFELTVPFENDESSLSLINLSIEENGETHLAIVSEFQFMPDLTLVYNCDNNQWMIMYPHQGGDELTSVNCEHDGCDFMGTVEAVATHSEKCGYRKIQCVNSNDGRGCLDSVVCKDMDNHLKSCSYARVDCENAKMGCDFVMFRRERKKHEKECLYYRVHCPNEGCEYTCFQRELESHQASECPESKKNCPYCEMAFTRRTLEEHKKKCESRLERCSICSDEIPEKDYPSHAKDCAKAKLLANPHTAKHTEIYVHCIKRLALIVEELEVKKQKLEDGQCSICRAITERSEEEQPQESNRWQWGWGWVREPVRIQGEGESLEESLKVSLEESSEDFERESEIWQERVDFAKQQLAEMARRRPQGAKTQQQTTEVQRSNGGQ